MVRSPSKNALDHLSRMSSPVEVVEFGSIIGDPARALMLCALLAEAISATELVIGCRCATSAPLYPLIDGVLFGKNRFDEAPGPAILAASFKNLVFRNNRGEPQEGVACRAHARQRPRRAWNRPFNAWTIQTGLDTAKLFYDADTTPLDRLSRQPTKSSVLGSSKRCSALTIRVMALSWGKIGGGVRPLGALVCGP